MMYRVAFQKRNSILLTMAFVAVGLFACLDSTNGASVSHPDVNGTWIGTLGEGASTIGLTLTIGQSGNHISGWVSSKMEMIDGTTEIFSNSFDGVIVDNTQIKIDLNIAGSRYALKLYQRRKKLMGTFELVTATGSSQSGEIKLNKQDSGNRSASDL